LQELAESLADFNYAHRFSNAGFTEGLPTGYCHIGVFAPLAAGQWRDFRAFETVIASRALIELRISEKNRRLADYRAPPPKGLPGADRSA
jgi:hypothetical protein